MTGDRLPAVLNLNPLPGEGAVLMLDDGAERTVCSKDSPYLTGPTGSRLMLWKKSGDPSESSHYRVPPQLAGALTWALALQPRVPPTLEKVEQDADAITFIALQDGGFTYILTVPRACLFHLTFPIASADPDAPLLLTVSENVGPSPVSIAPTRIFFFKVYPGTPRGAACLAALEAFGVSK